MVDIQFYDPVVGMTCLERPQSQRNVSKSSGRRWQIHRPRASVTLEQDHPDYPPLQERGGELPDGTLLCDKAHVTLLCRSRHRQDRDYAHDAENDESDRSTE